MGEERKVFLNRVETDPRYDKVYLVECFFCFLQCES